METVELVRVHPLVTLPRPCNPPGYSGVIKVLVQRNAYAAPGAQWEIVGYTGSTVFAGGIVHNGEGSPNFPTRHAALAWCKARSIVPCYRTTRGGWISTPTDEAFKRATPVAW